MWGTHKANPIDCWQYLFQICLLLLRLIQGLCNIINVSVFTAQAWLLARRSNRTVPGIGSLIYVFDNNSSQAVGDKNQRPSFLLCFLAHRFDRRVLAWFKMFADEADDVS